jgi:hypothetical protein
MTKSHPAPGLARASATRSRRAAGLPALLAAAAALAATAAHAEYAPFNTFDLQPASGFSRTQASANSAAQQFGFGTDTATSLNHALVWTSSAAYIDLNPAGYDVSKVMGTDGYRHVGSASSVSLTGNQPQAVLWNGTTGTFTNLHPVGYLTSYAVAVAGNQQVGAGTAAVSLEQQSLALLWTGSAASAVSLNPDGFTTSVASGTNGTQQVGYGGGPSTGDRQHALMWLGTAASAVDLTPATYSYAYAFGIGMTQQVGYGGGLTPTGDHDNALLWTGSAGSFVNLNPAGFTASYANATNDEHQVGYGYHPDFANNYHALMWSGTAAGFTDLQALLPGAPTSSLASSIDVYGNIAGYATYAGKTHAVAWLAGNVYRAAPGASSWSTAANWSSGVPAAGNDVLLIASDAQARTVAYANPGGLAFNKLIVDATNGGTMALAQAGDTLTAGTEFIGYAGAGSVAQSGGIHNVGTLTLGARVGAAGAFTLSGGTLASTVVNINTGSSLVQTGGTHQAGTVIVGARAGGSGSYTLGGGTLTAADLRVQNNGVLTFNAGTLRATSLQVNNTGRVVTSPGANKALRVDTLSIGPAATIDLADNLLVLKYAGAVDQGAKIALLKGYIATGKAGGAWNGPGISSSTVPAAANTTLALADNADLNLSTLRGESSLASSLFVVQAHIGDANLDGKVNAFDLNLLAAHWQANGVLWSAGDFTGDGKVNAFDLNALAASWQFGTGGALEASLEEALGGFPQLVSVPEPASLLVLGIPAIALLRRRRA